MKRLINWIIQKLGRKNYLVDDHISTYSLLVIVISKFFQLLRGFWLKLFLKRSTGLIFLGMRCKIIHRNKISVGKSLTIGDNVEINALSKSGVTIGDNVSILKNSIIECTGVIRNLGEGLIIGSRVGIAQNCFIQVRGRVVIGNDVIFGPNVSIFSENHVFDDPGVPVSRQGETRKGVTIEDGAWIGTRAVILDGVTIGKNSIVAAGSLVKQDVPADAVVGGVPAKVLRQRTEI